MKRYAWLSIAVCLTGFEVWAVFGSSEIGPMNFGNHPALLSLIIVAFTVSGLGGWWMVFKIVRYEKRVFPVILLPFLVPNSFLWYYFERTAHGVVRKNFVRDGRPSKPIA